jgi:hypothetical protein
LLDFLATDLADHRYDLKHTLRLMATSRAYQLPGIAVDSGTAGDTFVFRGPFVKRLTAEQFVDTVFALTATWPGADPAQMKVDGRGQGGQLGAIAPVFGKKASSPPPAYDKPPLSQAKWVWSRPEARQAAPPETIYLRRLWSLDQRPARALATLTADNSIEFLVNGKTLAKSENWNQPVQVDLGDALRQGKNVIGLKAANGGTTPNPAGAIAEIIAWSADGKVLALLATDESWRVSETDPRGWLDAEFNDDGWKRASVLGDATIEPWRIAQSIGSNLSIAQASTALPPDFRVRAALLPLDSLQAALGRPNREQVVSGRDAAPTMLQALELTNGSPLAQSLQRGADYWQKRSITDARELVREIYLTALNRPPAGAELALAIEIAGSPTTKEGLEDLLWSICMLPEFQLIP